MKIFLSGFFLLFVFLSFSVNRKDSLLIFKWDIISIETEDSIGKNIETPVKGNYYFCFKKKVKSLLPLFSGEKQLQLQLVQNNNCTVSKRTKWECWIPSTIFYDKKTKTDSTKIISIYFFEKEEWLMTLLQNLPHPGFPAFDFMWRSKGKINYKNGTLIFDMTYDYMGKKKKLKLTCKRMS